MRYCMALLVMSWCAGRSGAQDVPQFRGLSGGGISTEKGLPVNFSDVENLRYKALLPGRGLSNPVIAGGRVYLTACSEYQEKKLHVICLDQKDGRLVWERRFRATGLTLCHPKTNMAAPTPVTNGDVVCALFATGDVACLDKDGNLLWYRSLVSDYPTIGNAVGMAASPVLYKDLLLVDLVNVGESFLAAIDVKTGENRWRVPRPRDINWVTPLIVAESGRNEVIVQSKDGLFAHDLGSGKLLWSVTDEKFSGMASPIYGAGMVLAPGGKLAAIRLAGADKPGPVSAWKSSKLPTGYCSPIYKDGRVYALSHGGVLNCADAKDGKPLWDLRLEGKFAASPLWAEGRIYAVSEEGEVSVVQAGEEPQVLARNVLRDKILASPVAAGGCLFLRSDRYLYCFGK